MISLESVRASVTAVPEVHRRAPGHSSAFGVVSYSRSTSWVRLRFLLDHTDYCFTFTVIFTLFPLAVPLASCSGRAVRLYFVLVTVGSMIMTVVINARYLIFMHFYVLAFLASCSTRSVRRHFVLCKGSSIIMTVAINAHYLALMTSTPWRFWLCALQGAGGYASCCTTQTTASRSRSSWRSSFQRCLWLHALAGQ